MSRCFALRFACSTVGLASLASNAFAVNAPGVTYSAVSPTGYATGDINSVSISRNNLVTYGDYQFAAYYGTDNNIYIARRQTGNIATPSAWQTRNTGIGLPNSGATAITDDHNIVAMGIDGDGFMHLSWGMHNVQLTMADSSVAVNQATFGSGSNITFGQRSSVTGANESNATYPEFVSVPGSKDLLLFYRDGGVGGGSGNGNEYVNRYNSTTKAWTQVAVPFLQGTSSDPNVGYNGYLNTVVYDHAGNLQTTWTWRESPDFQTNHDILYAKSANNGVNWTKQDGTPYTLGITQANAQVVKPIAQGSSLINQSSMTVDNNDRPVLATWYAPKTSSGNYARQYMLEYFDGSVWKESQISNFARDGSKTTNDAADIRATGRPLVMVDKDNRVIVVYRDTADSNNGLTLSYSLDRINWTTLSLSTASMGQYEPSYDPVLWQTQNILNLFYQPTALGQASAAVQVLQWDAGAYFASIPEPASLGLMGLAGVGLLRRSRRGR